MIVLGLDSSADTCGAALVEEGTTLAAAWQRLGPAGVAPSGRHPAGTGASPARAVGRLLPLVDAVLAVAGLAGDGPAPAAAPAACRAHAGLTRIGLGGIAVTVGPGSYTGLRAAVGTAQGLALALGLPVAPVGTLDALAYRAGPRVEPVAACVDARRGRVYGALYRGWEPSGAVADGPPELVDAGVWAASLPRPVFLTGNGVPSVEAHLSPPEALSFPVGLRAVDPAAVALVGWERLRSGGGIDAAALSPLYVSRPQLVPPRGPQA